MASQCVTAQIKGSPYGLNRLPHLGSSLLQVLIPNEVQSMWKEETWQTEAGRSARTLVKYPDLRIVLVSMKAGTRFKPHKTSARFAILMLAGHVRLHLLDATVEVPRGELLALDRDVSHDVEAIRQSTFLLILARPNRKKEKYHE
jgi:quercetin dioxygenase-like cupin family protein